MDHLQSAAKSLIDSFSSNLESQGFNISEIKLNQYCYELLVNRSKEKIKILVYFGKKGTKTILQGDKQSELYKEFSQIINGEELFEIRDDFSEPAHYIGTDESGKGDYFGPLVIAGVISNSDEAEKLKNVGVKDSKLLSDSAIDEMVPLIKNILKDNFNIITISPATYNTLHEKMGNVNRILGWAHAKVIENLLMKTDVPEAISDKFGDESYIIRNLQEKGKVIKLHQFTKAERFTGVAAASMLARNSFNNWFKEKKAIGMDLPKGASSIVDKKVKEIRNMHDIAYLSQIAKLHFKTTNK